MSVVWWSWVRFNTDIWKQFQIFWINLQFWTVLRQNMTLVKFLKLFYPFEWQILKAFHAILIFRYKNGLLNDRGAGVGGHVENPHSMFSPQMGSSSSVFQTEVMAIRLRCNLNELRSVTATSQQLSDFRLVIHGISCHYKRDKYAEDESAKHFVSKFPEYALLRIRTFGSTFCRPVWHNTNW